MAANPTKQPHLVFISPYCALDLKSGASQAIRSILQAMTTIGWRASSFTGSCQDTPSGLPSVISEQIKNKKMIAAQDKSVQHHIFQFSTHQRTLITAREESHFYHLYCSFLDKYKPTHVITFGGLLSERLLATETKNRQIKSAFYLANPNYKSAHNFFEMFDFVLTDSNATAELYREITPTMHNIGHFIERDKVAPTKISDGKKYVTFINPSLEKGVEVVLKIIHSMRNDQDIQFLIVESRGTWSKAIKAFDIDHTLFNGRVKVATFQSNMSAIYAKTKLLLAPSLWHESGPRVAAEAILNDIPVLGFNSGGIPEMLGASGYIFKKPNVSKENNFKLPPNYDVTEWVDKIRDVMRNSKLYEQQISLIQNEKARYDLSIRAKHLESVINPHLLLK